MTLILASSSPYRRELLQRLGLPFSCRAPDIDEAPQPGEQPAGLSLRLAREKALHVARGQAGTLVVGSDQVADCGGIPVGKPGSFEAARDQLRRFSGRTIIFHTAVCTTDGHDVQLARITTECTFLALDERRIEAYLRREQPYDAAGSARVERLGIALMDRIRSDDPTALIGLPLITVCRMLRHFGLEPLAAPAGPEPRT